MGGQPRWGRERPQPANAATDYKAIIPLIAAS